MRTRILVASIPFAGCLSLVGCLSDGGSAISDPAFPNGDWDTVITLPVAELSVDRIVTTHPERIDAHCSSNYVAGSVVPVLRYDTTEAGRDTILCKLEGAHLWIGDTAYLDSTRKILSWSGTRRVSGTGIQGAWDFDFTASYTALGIPLDDSAFRYLRGKRDSILDAEKTLGMAERIEISSSALTASIRYPSWADLGLLAWRSGQSVDYDVTLAKVDENTLVYTAKDGTEATIARLDRRTTRYSSSNPSKYPEYVVVSNPSDVSQCPANAWFYAFLRAYWKGSASARAMVGTSAVPGLPLSPLP